MPAASWARINVMQTTAVPLHRSLKDQKSKVITINYSRTLGATPMYNLKVIVFIWQFILFYLFLFIWSFGIVGVTLAWLLYITVSVHSLG